MHGLAGLQTHLGQGRIDIEILVEEEIANHRDPHLREPCHDFLKPLAGHGSERVHDAVGFPRVEKRDGIAGCRRVRNRRLVYSKSAQCKCMTAFLPCEPKPRYPKEGPCSLPDRSCR